MWCLLGVRPRGIKVASETLQTVYSCLRSVVVAERNLKQHQIAILSAFCEHERSSLSLLQALITTQESHYPHGALKRHIKDGIAKTFWLSGLSETTGLCYVSCTPLPIVRTEIIVCARWPETLFSRPILGNLYIFCTICFTENIACLDYIILMQLPRLQYVQFI